MKVDGNWLGKAGQEIHVHAGEKIVLEAGSELTVKAGGSWLKLNAAGVHFGGTTINIAGGGSPGEGTEAEPLLPILWPFAQVQFIDQNTGEVIPEQAYEAYVESILIFKGISDKQGKTHRIHTKNECEVEFVIIHN